MVAYRADTADPGCDYWHLPENPTFAEFFEASKLCYIELGINHIACLVQLDGYFAMSFNSANLIYLDCFLYFSNLFLTTFVEAHHLAGQHWESTG